MRFIPAAHAVLPLLYHINKKMKIESIWILLLSCLVLETAVGTSSSLKRRNRTGKSGATRRGGKSSRARVKKNHGSNAQTNQSMNGSSPTPRSTSRTGIQSTQVNDSNNSSNNGDDDTFVANFVIAYKGPITLFDESNFEAMTFLENSIREIYNDELGPERGVELDSIAFKRQRKIKDNGSDSSNIKDDNDDTSRFGSQGNKDNNRDTSPSGSQGNKDNNSDTSPSGSQGNKDNNRDTSPSGSQGNKDSNRDTSPSGSQGNENGKMSSKRQNKDKKRKKIIHSQNQNKEARCKKNGKKKSSKSSRSGCTRKSISNSPRKPTSNSPRKRKKNYSKQTDTKRNSKSKNKMSSKSSYQRSSRRFENGDDDDDDDDESKKKGKRRNLRIKSRTLAKIGRSIKLLNFYTATGKCRTCKGSKKLLKNDATRFLSVQKVNGPSLSSLKDLQRRAQQTSRESIVRFNQRLVRVLTESNFRMFQDIEEVSIANDKFGDGAASKSIFM